MKFPVVANVVVVAAAVDGNAVVVVAAAVDGNASVVVTDVVVVLPVVTVGGSLNGGNV